MSAAPPPSRSTSRAVAADQQRDRLLHRPRRQQERVVDVHVPAVMRHDFAGQQPRHDVDGLDESPDPFGRGRILAPGHGPLRRRVPGAEPEDEAPVREHVEGRRVARDRQRVADAGVEHVRAELQRRRDAGRGRQRGERRGGDTEMVGDVERVEAGVLGLPREIEPGARVGVEAGLQSEADRRNRHARRRYRAVTSSGGGRPRSPGRSRPAKPSSTAADSRG